MNSVVRKQFVERRNIERIGEPSQRRRAKAQAALFEPPDRGWIQASTGGGGGDREIFGAARCSEGTTKIHAPNLRARLT